MKRVMTTLVLAVFVPLAADASDLKGGLAKCAAIKRGVQRLDCYDALAQDADVSGTASSGDDARGRPRERLTARVQRSKAPVSVPLSGHHAKGYAVQAECEAGVELLLAASGIGQREGVSARP